MLGTCLQELGQTADKDCNVVMNHQVHDHNGARGGCNVVINRKQSQKKFELPPRGLE